VFCTKEAVLERLSFDTYFLRNSARMVTENTRMVMFISFVVLLGIICVVANIDSYDENGSMIPIVINTWPFTNATQSGKNSDVTIEIGGGFRCDNCIRRVCK
jgi:hypothetical protein